MLMKWLFAFLKRLWVWLVSVFTPFTPEPAEPEPEEPVESSVQVGLRDSLRVVITPIDEGGVDS